jgi:hypothetical protein
VDAFCLEAMSLDTFTYVFDRAPRYLTEVNEELETKLRRLEMLKQVAAESEAHVKVLIYKKRRTTT